MVSKTLFSSASCEWATPQDLFNALDDEFDFAIDVCATPENAKRARFFTKEQNGLLQDWGTETVWCNPPYGREIGAWVRKCAEHAENGGIAVMLLPARTDTRWFHDYIWHAGMVSRPRHPVTEIRFLKGRLKFGGSPNPAPFPSMIVVMQG